MRIFPELLGGRWDERSDELLLDGNIYPDSNYTKWKLVMSNVSILNLMTIPTLMIYLRPKKLNSAVLAVVVLLLVKHKEGKNHQ